LSSSTNINPESNNWCYSADLLQQLVSGHINFATLSWLAPLFGLLATNLESMTEMIFENLTLNEVRAIRLLGLDDWEVGQGLLPLPMNFTQPIYS